MGLVRAGARIPPAHPFEFFSGLQPAPGSIARLPGQRLGSSWRARSPALPRGCGGSHRRSGDERTIRAGHADPTRPPIWILSELHPGPCSIARLPRQRLGSTWRARSPARSRGCGGSHRCSDDGRAVCAEARIPPAPNRIFSGLQPGPRVIGRLPGHRLSAVRRARTPAVRRIALV
jgi:hypothetical protein